MYGEGGLVYMFNETFIGFSFYIFLFHFIHLELGLKLLTILKKSCEFFLNIHRSSNQTDTYHCCIKTNICLFGFIWWPCEAYILLK